MLRTLLLSALLSLPAAGCSCGDDGDPGGGDGGMDGAAGGDGATPDGAGGDTGPGCAPTGGGCSDTADCCTNMCLGGTCSGDMCAAMGDACTDAGDCCSGRCRGGTCDAPACTRVGNPCTASGDCCSGQCAGSGGGDCMGAGDCVCAPAAACEAQGGACRRDRDCCNNLCDRPGGGMGTCATFGACLTAGEPCSTPGLSGSCCSTVCLDTDGTGPRCQFLGGCRVQDELCTTDAQCCSSRDADGTMIPGACAETGRTLDDRPILRCANLISCLPVGEVCGEGGASSNCCPNGGGDFGCEPTGTGFRRCFGGEGGMCILPGRPCMNTMECCMDPYPNIMCQPGRAGTNICCLSDGEECAFGDVCCSGICTPDPSDGVLRCGAVCIPDGVACTTDADCCGCGCISDGMGGQTCTSDPGLCAACTGPQLGELCDPAGEPCCNGPTVICAGAVEFPTCILAP